MGMLVLTLSGPREAYSGWVFLIDILMSSSVLSSRIIPSFYLANEACQICSVIFQLASLWLSMFLSYLFLLHQCYAMKNQCHTFKWRPNTSLPKVWIRTPGMNWLLMLYYLNISGFFFFFLTFLRLLLFLNMNPLTLQQWARKLSKAFHGILFLLIYLKLSIFWSILCSLSMIL